MWVLHRRWISSCRGMLFGMLVVVKGGIMKRMHNACVSSHISLPFLFSRLV